MMYSKAIIDLIRETRRRVSSEKKPSIKLANPEVFDELNEIYHHTSDAILKALVKELFHLMGGDWPEKLKPTVQSSGRFYRGVEIPVADLKEKVQAPKQLPKRIYRGQAIPD
ncbi:hypothetical protein QWZ13_08540 [Reinekea marina]|uniref:Uncharacterized protein n=1 Tax=Reinekea marina TaxID=1310421 RepID=A0ABV7WVB5_9GAMM|nr:hypothetical protein [Reinekea marina]MBU2862719.1 hypothetical protein [Reinekea forsetii]MDN3648957.1 hypothetical protein [Reinekea marina]